MSLKKSPPTTNTSSNVKPANTDAEKAAKSTGSASGNHVAKQPTNGPAKKRKKPKGHAIVYLDHARVDLMHCIADGLFRPLQRGAEKGVSLDIHYKIKSKGFTLWWRNYQLLSIADQSVFLAIHRLLSEKKRARAFSAPQDDNEKALLTMLNVEQNDAQRQAVMLETSLSEIARTIGLSDGGANLKNIADSIIRLSSVVCAVYANDDPGKKFWQANLFSFLRMENNKVFIAANPMLSNAILINRNSYVDMQNQRELHSDAAKRLHFWLSGWADEDKLKKIELDHLIPHVWGDVPQADVDIRNRRRILRKAIEDVAQLPGWTCYENKERMVFVQKPSFVGHANHLPAPPTSDDLLASDPSVLDDIQ